jgi:hypothetical protein
MREILYKCEKCNGTGLITREVTHDEFNKRFGVKTFSDGPWTEKCSNCNGEGKLNWIENIFGITDSLEDLRNKITNVVGIPRKYLFGE